jgi:hypothetical protein
MVMMSTPMIVAVEMLAAVGESVGTERGGGKDDGNREFVRHVCHS